MNVTELNTFYDIILSYYYRVIKIAVFTDHMFDYYEQNVPNIPTNSSFLLLIMMLNKFLTIIAVYLHLQTFSISSAPMRVFSHSRIYSTREFQCNWLLFLQKANSEVFSVVKYVMYDNKIFVFFVQMKLNFSL